MTTETPYSICKKCNKHLDRFSNNILYLFQEICKTYANEKGKPFIIDTPMHLSFLLYIMELNGLILTHEVGEGEMIAVKPLNMYLQNDEYVLCFDAMHRLRCGSA